MSTVQVLKPAKYKNADSDKRRQLILTGVKAESVLDNQTATHVQVNQALLA